MREWLFVLAVIVGGIVGHYTIPNFDSSLLMLALISALVIAHEFGHFIVAKSVGVKVERFGMGLPFGPTLFEKKVGETVVCVHLMLLGGYVSFPDDNADSDVPEDSPLRFENKPVWARAAIAVAGVTVNFLMAYLIMFYVIAHWGVPGSSIEVTKLMSETSPAAVAGLQVGDHVLKVGDQRLHKGEVVGQMKAYFSAHKNEPVSMTIVREGEEKELTVTPGDDGLIGFVPYPKPKFEAATGPQEIVQESHAFLVSAMVANFKAYGMIFTGQVGREDVLGPVGILKKGGQIINTHGVRYGLIITALISTILAVINLLPVPMLDGGHLLFMLIELLRGGKPLNKELQERVMQVSFFILMGLMGLILCNDLYTHILGR